MDGYLGVSSAMKSRAYFVEANKITKKQPGAVHGFHICYLLDLFSELTNN